MKVNEEGITPTLEGVQLAITISGEQEVLAAQQALAPLHPLLRGITFEPSGGLTLRASPIK